MSEKPSSEELFRRVLERLDSFQYIRDDDIPAIDLYMDQVTTFMDAHLSGLRRREEDKVLTKTMINNYAKNNLLPSPVNKKYSKNHMLQLIFIYYLKSFLSINDIEATLGPIAEDFWSSDSSPSFAEIYRTVFSQSEAGMKEIKKDLNDKFTLSRSMFADAPDNKREELQLFALLCMIDYDIYMKKQAVTSLLDQLKESRDASDARRGKEKKKK